MLDTAQLGKLAAELQKTAVKRQRGRAGRNIKGESMQKHLHAAGEPKMNTGTVIGFPRGKKWS
jgi:hypothetical protein